MCAPFRSGCLEGGSPVKVKEGSPQKLNTELPLDPRVPLVGIYPKETKTPFRKNGCAPVFLAIAIHNS